MDPKAINFTQYRKGQLKGHYESFFQRANHPSLPFAFWIRYTIFSPEKHPEKSIAELWAIFFDGTSSSHISVKKEFPLTECFFHNEDFHVQIADAVLNDNMLQGSAASEKDTISWKLNYKNKEQPLFVLPEKLYHGPFPKAKLLVGSPNAIFSGEIKVNNKIFSIENWTGSQNHNWGPKHTDNYAWGQVAGFDNYSESFFEVSTARLKFGPLWTPFFTLMVLRHKGREFRLNTIIQALKAKGKFQNSKWHFASQTEEIKIEGTISSNEKDFVELQYYNPPGGIKKCLNSKIASCTLDISYKNDHGSQTETLHTKNRAAFEILY